MINRYLLLLALFASPPAIAEVATISGCKISGREQSQPAIFCDITNNSQRSIASVSFDAVLESPGREVPWAEVKYKTQGRRTDIPGGIEQFETVNVYMATVFIPSRASDIELILKIIEADFYALDKTKITESQ